jgi:hypothetical protein
MLIQQLTGAFGAQFLSLTFGPGTAPPCAIGGGLLFRPLFLDGLHALFQIDQIPHGGPRHVNLAGVETTPPMDERVRAPVEMTRSKFSGYALASSILIMNSPLCRLIAKMQKCRVSFFRNIFCSTTAKCHRKSQ